MRQADDGASGIVREIEVLVGRRDPDLPGRDGPSRDLDALAFDREVAPDVVDPDVLIARPDVHPSLDPLPGDFRVISSDGAVRGGILDDDLPIAVIDPDLCPHSGRSRRSVWPRLGRRLRRPRHPAYRDYSCQGVGSLSLFNALGGILRLKAWPSTYFFYLDIIRSRQYNFHNIDDMISKLKGRRMGSCDEMGKNKFLSPDIGKRH